MRVMISILRYRILSAGTEIAREVEITALQKV